MIRLTAKNVIALHKQMIEKTGGSYGVRDEGLLESALASPFMTYDQIELFPSVYQKAARLCFGFVKNHPFIDGNGRTSRLLMNLYLLRNGYTLVTLKGSNEDKISYYKALEESHTENKPEAFQKLIVEAEIASLQRYLSIMQ